MMMMMMMVYLYDGFQGGMFSSLNVEVALVNFNQIRCRMSNSFKRFKVIKRASIAMRRRTTTKRDVDGRERGIGGWKTFQSVHSH